MQNIVFNLYDLIQIGLMLLACYACFKAGHKRGVEDTLDFMESEGIIESEEKVTRVKCSGSKVLF